LININNLDAMADFSNDRLGNYRLIRLLGHGGFASVYLGEHLYLKRPAAIKVLRTVLKEKEKERFLAEAKLLAKLSHPHIVHVLEFAVAKKHKVIQNHIVKEHIPFLVMDYAPGGNLRSSYPEGTRLAPNQVITYIKQLADALQYAHNQNIIHRDIKPENFLLNEQQDVMLSDFGLALFAPFPDQLSLQGMAGTVAYSAPEQLRGKPLFASDQYALAIVAYEWLCGQRPFQGTEANIIMQHMSSPAPRLRDKNPLITREAEEVILRALAKDPKKRYPRIQDFAQALEDACQISAPQPAIKLSRTGMAPAVRSPRTNAVPAVRLHHPASRNAAEPSPDANASLAPRATAQPDKSTGGITPSMARNRQRMLQKVRAFWITGILETSLQGTSFIMPGLHEQPAAVANPWGSPLQQPAEYTRPLAPDTPITQVYDQSGGELLMLGEAGAGKTTLLLELARSLLDRAEQDENAPIPVIFLLSSWSEKQLPLDQWLIEELYNKYQVPYPLAERWLRSEILLPLLDGLDEVATNARSACITAINAYREAHGLSPMVICSRPTEYLLCTPRVLLRRAVVIQPLTQQQIESYLQSAGQNFALAHEILRHDQEMQELLTTPFMLNILVSVCQNKSAKEIVAAYFSPGMYQHLFHAYVEQTLQHHPAATASYKPSQLIRWLAYLAEQMQKYGQTVFYIEHMQPQWITKQFWLQLYMWLAVLLPGALIGALTGTLSNDLLFHAGDINSIFIDGLYGAIIGYLLSGRAVAASSPSTAKTPAAQHSTEQSPPNNRLTTSALFVGILTCLCLGLTKGWMDGLINGAFMGLMSLLLSPYLQKRAEAKLCRKSADDKRAKPPRKCALLNHYKPGLLIGLTCGLSSMLTLITTQNIFSLHLLYVLSLGLRDSLRSALIAALLGALLIQNDGFIHHAEIFAWSWQRFLHKLLAPRQALISMLIGLIVGSSSAVKQLLQMNLNNVLSSGLSDGILLAVSYCLISAMLAGITRQNLDNHHRTKPDECLKRASIHAVIGAIIGMITGVISYLASNALSVAISYELSGLPQSDKALPAWLAAGLKAGIQQSLHVDFYLVLKFGLIGGLFAGLLLGGLGCLQHGVLRFILWRMGVLPLKITDFLDSAADSALLHRVGGGYIFFHRLLLEYFATLSKKQIRIRNKDNKSSESEPFVKLR
jgi:serine/threonine protein kinase/DNA polymerase III delta prime subunit